MAAGERRQGVTMQRALALPGGFDAGPLFQHGNVRRPPKRRPGTTDHGRIRRQAELRATPQWADRAAIRALFKQAERLTRETGVMHSVDHLVPLQNPLVCGLHWHGNMEVQPLAANMAKGNRVWPGMWEQQLELVT